MSIEIRKVIISADQKPCYQLSSDSLKSLREMRCRENGVDIIDKSVVSSRPWWDERALQNQARLLEPEKVLKKVSESSNNLALSRAMEVSRIVIPNPGQQAKRQALLLRRTRLKNQLGEKSLVSTSSAPVEGSVEQLNQVLQDRLFQSAKMATDFFQAADRLQDWQSAEKDMGRRDREEYLRTANCLRATAMIITTILLAGCLAGIENLPPEQQEALYAVATAVATKDITEAEGWATATAVAQWTPIPPPAETPPPAVDEEVPTEIIVYKADVWQERIPLPEYYLDEPDIAKINWCRINEACQIDQYDCIRGFVKSEGQTYRCDSHDTGFGKDYDWVPVTVIENPPPLLIESLEQPPLAEVPSTRESCQFEGMGCSPGETRPECECIPNEWGGHEFASPPTTVTETPPTEVLPVIEQPPEVTTQVLNLGENEQIVQDTKMVHEFGTWIKGTTENGDHYHRLVLDLNLNGAIVTFGDDERRLEVMRKWQEGHGGGLKIMNLPIAFVRGYGKTTTASIGLRYNDEFEVVGMVEGGLQGPSPAYRPRSPANSPIERRPALFPGKYSGGETVSELEEIHPEHLTLQDGSPLPDLSGYSHDQLMELSNNVMVYDGNPENPLRPYQSTDVTQKDILSSMGGYVLVDGKIKIMNGIPFILHSLARFPMAQAPWIITRDTWPKIQEENVNNRESQSGPLRDLKTILNFVVDPGSSRPLEVWISANSEDNGNCAPSTYGSLVNHILGIYPNAEIAHFDQNAIAPLKMQSEDRTVAFGCGGEYTEELYHADSCGYYYCSPLSGACENGLAKSGVTILLYGDQ